MALVQNKIFHLLRTPVTADNSRLTDERAPTAAGIAIKTHAATAKTPLVDLDEIAIADSAATYGLKKVVWSVIVSTLKTYFDTLYSTLSHATRHDAGGADAMAIDASAGTGSLRTLGSSSTAACAGNDARLSDSRAPSGSAGGDLGGTYPNPGVVKVNGGAVPLSAKVLGSDADGKLVLAATPAADNTYANPTSITIVNGIVTAIS